MDLVLAVHAEDADCVVQPGVTREALNTYLRDTGLFFPVDPGANATLGGMISTRASGTTTVRYGTIAQNVLALEVVLANGDIVRCGSRARKSSAGYDLVRLMTGAEGTLGIITEATLRLHGQPEAVGSAVCSFAQLRDAVEAVIELIQSGAPLARIEFLDEVQVRACNAYSNMSLREQPTLFIEFHGTANSVKEQFERAGDVVRSHGATGFEAASDEQRRSQLWRARHAAYFAALGLRPGCECVVADVCVPISGLAECVEATRREIDAAGLIAPIVGHVGDGNFHVLFLLEPGNAAERARMERVYDAMIDHAHSLDGTCTGEHGIGLGKRDKLVAEFGAPVVALMRRLKEAWDPHGILNPGKVFHTT
jgi:D-lactate dehydrogenase (cytochrome)